MLPVYRPSKRAICTPKSKRLLPPNKRR
jgi:hypothetical protein